MALKRKSSRSHTITTNQKGTITTNQKGTCIIVSAVALYLFRSFININNGSIFNEMNDYGELLSIPVTRTNKIVSTQATSSSSVDANVNVNVNVNADADADADFSVNFNINFNSQIVMLAGPHKTASTT
jgi:hypothetical protein